MSIDPTTLAFYFPGGWEWIVILVIALLIFGKRLPDVGKSLGKGIVEFKKGLKGMQEEMDDLNQEVEDATNRSEEEDRKRLDGEQTDQIDEEVDRGGATASSSQSQRSTEKDKAGA